MTDSAIRAHSGPFNSLAYFEVEELSKTAKIEIRDFQLKMVILFSPPLAFFRSFFPGKKWEF